MLIRSPQQVVVIELGKRHDTTDFCLHQLVTDLLRGSHQVVTDLSFMLRSCYALVSDTMWKWPTCYGLATGKMV